MTSRFWLAAYIARLLDSHFSLVYFSGLAEFSHLTRKMCFNAQQSDSNGPFQLVRFVFPFQTTIYYSWVLDSFKCRLMHVQMYLWLMKSKRKIAIRTSRGLKWGKWKKICLKGPLSSNRKLDLVGLLYLNRAVEQMMRLKIYVGSCSGQNLFKRILFSCQRGLRPSRSGSNHYLLTQCSTSATTMPTNVWDCAREEKAYYTRTSWL